MNRPELSTGSRQEHQAAREYLLKETIFFQEKYGWSGLQHYARELAAEDDPDAWIRSLLDEMRGDFYWLLEKMTDFHAALHPSLESLRALYPEEARKLVRKKDTALQSIRQQERRGKASLDDAFLREGLDRDPRIRRRVRDLHGIIQGIRLMLANPFYNPEVQ